MELVLPTETYKESYLEALREFQAEGRSMDKDIALIENNFSGYLAKLEKESRGEDLDEGRVPATNFWLIDHDTYIGRVNIRHTLNENLEKIGGHIGYEIRPSKRMKGYGSEMLRLALPKAKALGITEALLTCDAGNIGSRKIIEKNGGVFADRVPHPHHDDKLRFKIALK